MGRSGGTLLKKIINCDPKFEIHGENHGVLRSIMELDRLMKMTRSISYTGIEKPFTSTNTAWHGYTRYSTYSVLASVLAFREDVVSGYKEVRHGGGCFEEFSSEMDFLLEVCPQSLLVFNTREIDEVVRSQVKHWDGGNSDCIASRQETACRQYENFMRYHERVPRCTRIVDYDDIVGVRERFTQVLSTIGYEPDVDFVQKILQFKIG